MKKLVLVLLLAVSSVSMLAQKPKVVTSDKTGWHKIGETTVDFKNESDQILVLGADRFASVKIKVTDAPINLISFDIFFENGEKYSVTEGQEIKIPAESKTVALGGEKSIKSVSFRYQTLGNSTGKKAHVELWGMKTNADK
ncbi:hypothetical protein [Flavobacterium humi]|uniref:DUF2541 family protein n=1 Tax=Flavobacterium humi TaxID=2562683 RepID=A0A4Z0LCA3_9FLAO|nr:hypothetical protein [Flavobacterium humi]TGD59520.1 hypothetical protein E4635_00880 [Flavobacterium humi]